MGASQSSSATTPKQGLHVLRVAPGSPADGTEIEPYFSFLVGFEGFQGGQSGSLEAAELERIVEAHEGRTLTLHVWNSKYRETKSVSITPSKTWNARAASEHEPQPSQLLGLSVRLCQPEFAMDNVWHVLDVAEGSPAESAGLVPMGDWVLGWSGGVLSAENDFYDLVEAHVDKPLRVYVYSYDFDALREVVLIPNRHWGGDGLLGCVFGFGLLHRIP
ncbi:GRASP55/65 PDZ-like domain-containing protein, partial [Flagelloscypha sp. PMI_526]